MIDLHSHILPGVDDGARTLTEALDMLRMAIDGGVVTQVLTPHIHQGRYNNTRGDLQEQFRRFQEKVDAANLDIKLLLAAEMRIGSEILNLAQNNEIPCLGEFQGKKTFLLEFPRTEIPFGSENLIKWLLNKDYLPVIVHPERNATFLRHSKKLAVFTDLGCLLQVTASSLTGKFGSEVKDMTEELLEAGLVNVIASDCHNLKGRAPDLIKGFDSAALLVGELNAKNMVTTTPNNLVYQNNMGS